MFLLPFAKTDPEIRNYVPANLSSRISTDLIEKEFGIQDMVVIIFSDSSVITPENLGVIEKAESGFKQVGNVSGIISPFSAKSIKGEDGILKTDKLIDAIPFTPEEVKELEGRASENQLMAGMVFSSDFRHAAIMMNIDTLEGEMKTLSRVDSIINNLPQHTMKVHKGGLPYIRYYIMNDVKRDAAVVVPISVAILLLVLMFMLKSWKRALMPFSVVILSTAICMSIIPLLGWKISIITMLVPVILIAVANNYGIYMVSYRPEGLDGDVISDENYLHSMFISLKMPVLFSGFTTIAGLLGLLTHSIIPARQAGLLSASGVFIALTMSLFLIPAYLASKKEKTISNISKPEGKHEKRFGTRIVRYPVTILIVTLIIILSVSSGIFFLRTDTNQENFFPATHPLREASAIINSDFGGSQTVSMLIKGDIKDPAIMSRIDSITKSISGIHGVGKVFSISVAVREISKAIFEKGEAGYDAIPASRDAIAQYFELYYMSGERDDFKQLINSEEDKAHILIKLSDPEYEVIQSVRAAIGKFNSDEKFDISTGGYALIMAEFASSIIKGQVYSLLFALVTVFILLAIIFRSVTGGLFGSIPLAVSIVLLFGIMGIAGIALDSATAILSSVMIGVGIDFTIQYLWFFARELKVSKDYTAAAIVSNSVIGRSILVNGLSVMAGFSALLFSGFTSIRFFGWLTIISIGSCLAGALVIIPALLIVFRPRFIEKISQKS